MLRYTQNFKLERFVDDHQQKCMNLSKVSKINYKAATRRVYLYAIDYFLLCLLFDLMRIVIPNVNDLHPILKAEIYIASDNQKAFYTTHVPTDWP
jgi:hypothetical protein